MLKKLCIIISKNRLKMDNIQIGERNAYEYAWSRNIHELITQLYFQITDTYSYNQIYVIKTIFHICNHLAAI